MKIINLSILLVVLFVGVTSGPLAAHATPGTDPVPTAAPPDPPVAPPAALPDPATSQFDPVTSQFIPAPTSAHIPDDDDPIIIDEPDRPWSEGVSIENRKAAKEKFMKGNELFLSMLFARAAEQYETALGAWKHPAIYFNLAIAQLNLGKDVEARENLEHALKYGRDPLGAKAFLEAQRQLEQVKRQLGRIRVTCRTPGAEVTLDGTLVLVGPGSYEGWVKAKHHDLTAKKRGYQAEARRVMVSAGEYQDLDLSLVTLTQAVDTTRRWATWKPWAVIAAGSAIVVTGGIFHAFSAKTFDAYDQEIAESQCVQQFGCPPEQVAHLAGYLTRGSRQQNIAYGGYAVGGILASTGVVLLYMNRPRLPEGRTGSSRGRATIVPVVSSRAFGIMVSMSH